MVLDIKDKEILKTSYDEVSSLMSEFLTFRSNTRIVLLENQLQLFQSLSAIILAFWALVTVSGSIILNKWSIFSGFLAVILLLFCTSYVRESIDNEDKSLNKTQLLLRDKIKEVENKISETLEYGDFNIFKNFLISKVNDQVDINERLSYAGEIVLFLFYLSLFSGIIALFNQYNFITKLSDLCALIVILLFAFTLSFLNWSTFLTKMISKVLNKIIIIGNI